MSSFLDKLRSGAGKAAFEADKLKRITAVQATIRSLRGDFEKIIVEAGRVAFRLHKAGEVSQPDLLAICERLAAIQAQIQAREQEVESIRGEVFVESLETLAYGHICPNGHGPLPSQDKFCQVCGAQATDVPPPAANPCASCGVLLTPDARFCSSCGYTVRPPASAAPQNGCARCGAALLPDAIFCAECGYRVETAESLTTASESVETRAEELTEPANEVGEAMDVMTAASDSEQLTTDAVSANGPFTPADESPGTLNSDEPEIEMAVAVKTVDGICPACEAPLLPEAVFCAECGHPIT